MKKSASLALAAALALSGVTAANARNHMYNNSYNSSNKTTGMSNKTTGASDTLTLTDAQRQSIWNDVSKQATKQNPPANFNAAVGAEIPSGLNTYPLPRQAARDVPSEAVPLRNDAGQIVDRQSVRPQDRRRCGALQVREPRRAAAVRDATIL